MNPPIVEPKVAYRHTVAAVVYKDDPILERRMYLAVQKPQWDKNEWSIVQGGLEEHGSSEEVALYQELIQELGTDNFGAPKQMPSYLFHRFSTRTYSRYPERQNYSGKKTKYFYVEYQGRRGEIRLGPELSSFRWMDREEFLSSVKYADELERVLEIMEKAEEEKVATEIKIRYSPKAAAIPV